MSAPPNTPVSTRPGASASVIVPAYNAARFLDRAVASAAEASGLAALQIVIVDDASTDTTARAAAGLAARYDGVEIHSNPRNLGPAGTRNTALAHARGDWIAVLDADDAYAPGRLARLIGIAEAEGLDAIADLPLLYDLAADRPAPDQLPADGGVDRLSLADFLQPDPATGLDLGLLKPVVRRDLVTSGLWRYPAGVRHGEDVALYIAAVRAGAKFGLLREAHYVFSTRIGAVSGAYSPGSVTTVDYPAIARQLGALADRLAGAGELDDRLAELIAARQADALRQNRIYGWTALRKRDWRRLGAWLGQDRRNLRTLARVLAAKLAGQRGLPE